MFVRGPGAGGKWQNYLWDSASGSLKPVGPEGIGDASILVSPDGSKIVGVGPDGRWWVYRADGGPATPLPPFAARDQPVGFRADGQSIFVANVLEDGCAMEVSVLDLASTRRSPWKTIRPTRPVDQVSNLAVTPDGRAYAYNYLIKTSELYLAEGIR